LAKIAVTLGIGALHVRQAFLHARLVHIANRHPVDIRERLFEIVDVLLADQAVADEADTDAIVGPQDPVIRSRGQGCHATEKTSASRWTGFHFVWHSSLLP